MGTSWTAGKLVTRVLLGLAVTTLLLALLARFVDLQTLEDLAASLTWGPVLLALVFWNLILVFRAWRFVLLAPRTPFATMLGIASVHSLLLRLLPLRTGELAYPLLVKRAGGAGLGESFLGIFLLRVVDATTVLIVFAVALSFHHGTYLGTRSTGLAMAAGAGLLGILAVLFLPRLFVISVRLLRWGLNLFSLGEHPRALRILDRFQGAARDFARLKTTTIGWLGLVSGAQWLLTFAAFFAIMRAFGLPVSFPQTILGATAGVVTGFLPIGGIGSFGTLEAGWALGFVLVGLPQESAVASGLGSSVLTLLMGVPAGVLGWLSLGRGQSTASQQVAPAVPEDKASHGETLP